MISKMTMTDHLGLLVPGIPFQGMSVYGHSQETSRSLLEVLETLCHLVDGVGILPSLVIN